MQTLYPSNKPQNCLTLKSKYVFLLVCSCIMMLFSTKIYAAAHVDDKSASGVPVARAASAGAVAAVVAIDNPMATAPGVQTMGGLPASSELPPSGAKSKLPPIGLCAHEAAAFAACLCNGPLSGANICRQLCRSDAHCAERACAPICCTLQIAFPSLSALVVFGPYWIATGPCTGQEARHALRAAVCCHLNSAMPSEVLAYNYGFECCKGDLWACCLSDKK